MYIYIYISMQKKTCSIHIIMCLWLDIPMIGSTSPSLDPLRPDVRG